MGDWDTTRLEASGKPTITVTATPCRHGPPGSHPIVGDVIGFSLTWDGQQHGALWISGDTVLYDGVRQVAERVDVGTAILHLGSVHFPITGPVKYTMTAKDAVELCELLRPDTACRCTTRVGATSSRGANRSSASWRRARRREQPLGLGADRPTPSESTSEPLVCLVSHMPLMVCLVDAHDVRGARAADPGGRFSTVFAVGSTW